MNLVSPEELQDTSKAQLAFRYAIGTVAVVAVPWCLWGAGGGLILCAGGTDSSGILSAMFLAGYFAILAGSFLALPLMLMSVAFGTVALIDEKRKMTKRWGKRAVASIVLSVGSVVLHYVLIQWFLVH